VEGATDLQWHDLLGADLLALEERRDRFTGGLQLGGPAAQADTVTVNVDQALVMKLPERVATIVIGNPLIADAALQAGGVLVITGKGYGATNLLALDRSGRVVMDKTVQVLSASGGDLVVVYKGVERETYNCAPNCERRITLGDSQGYFNATLSESGALTGQAQAGSQPH
jgi:Flp pilus assembly secretin CpaC